VRAPLRRRREVGELLRDALALTVADWRALLVLSLLVVVPIEVVVFGVGLGWLTAGYEVASTPAQGLVLGVTSLLVSPLVFGMTITVLLQREAGEAPSLRRAASQAMDAFVALVGAAVLSGALIFAGLVLLVAPGIYAAVRLAVVLTVAMIERPPGVGALRRCTALTGAAVGHTAVVLVAVGLALAIPQAVVPAIFQSLARSADAQVLQLVGSIVGDTLSLAPAAVATTLLYFDLVERAGREEQGIGG
jgi:hypothetical protein